MMQRTTIVPILLCGSMLAFCMSRTFAEPAPIPPFRAAYVVNVKDKPKGTMEVSVSCDVAGTTYAVDMLFKSDQEFDVIGMVPGGKQRLLVRAEEGTLRPIQFSATQGARRNHHEAVAVFDWQRDVATFTMDGTTRKVPLRGGDPDGYRQGLLSVFYTGTFWVPGNYQIADEYTGMKKRTEGQEEEIQTPLGRYRARRLDLEQPRGEKATFWIAPDLNGLPVKVEFRDSRGSGAFVLATLFQESP